MSRYQFTFYPFRNVFSLALVLFAITSCSATRSKELSLPGDSRLVEGQTKTQILNSFRAQTSPTTFRAMLDTTIEARGRKENIKQALSFQRPDRLRLEAFATGINSLLFLVIADGNSLRALVPSEKQILFGDADSRAFAELISVPLASEELMVFVTGGLLPSFAKLESASLYEDDADQLIIRCEDQKGRELRFTARLSELPRIEKFSLKDDGTVILSGSYEYTYATDLVPGKIRFAIPDAVGEIVIKNAQPNVNFSSPAVFQLKEPLGYKRIPIGE